MAVSLKSYQEKTSLTDACTALTCLSCQSLFATRHQVSVDEIKGILFSKIINLGASYQVTPEPHWVFIAMHLLGILEPFSEYFIAWLSGRQEHLPRKILGSVPTKVSIFELNADVQFSFQFILLLMGNKNQQSLPLRLTIKYYLLNGLLRILFYCNTRHLQIDKSKIHL